MRVKTNKRCPKCRSNNFSAETIFYGGAEFIEVKNGSLLKPMSTEPAEYFEVLYEPQHMDCVGVSAKCHGCGHKWKFRGIITAESIFAGEGATS